MLTTRMFDDFAALRRDLDRFFDNWDGFDGSAGREGWAVAPAVETGWTDDYLNLRFVLPGVPEDNLETTVQGNSLIIRGERPAPQSFGKAGASHYRLPYGKFERKVDLPNGLQLDRIEAKLHYGVLDVRIPVAEEVKPRRIEIQAAPEAKAAKTLEAA